MFEFGARLYSKGHIKSVSRYHRMQILSGNVAAYEEWVVGVVFELESSLVDGAERGDLDCQVTRSLA